MSSHTPAAPVPRHDDFWIFYDSPLFLSCSLLPPVGASSLPFSFYIPLPSFQSFYRQVLFSPLFISLHLFSPLTSYSLSPLLFSPLVVSSLSSS